MKPLAVMLFFSLIAHLGQAQCVDTFELESVQPATPGNQDGKITFKVSTAQEFICELIVFSGSRPIVLAKKSGAGDALLEFDGLDNDQSYTVRFTLPGELSPYCRRRAISDIQLDNR